MKRKDYIKTLNTRELANEFYYFDLADFMERDYEKSIKNIMRWLNEDLESEG